jgi:hypothetical protein
VIQSYLWDEDNYHTVEGLDRILTKRLDKIRELDITAPHYKVELRKRLLQNAAVSIKFLELIEQDNLIIREE